MATDLDFLECKDWSLFYPERRHTVVPYAVLLGIGFAMLIFLVGCAATKPEQKVCFVKFLGKTEEGMVVVNQVCMTPEAFAESQK